MGEDLNLLTRKSQTRKKKFFARPRFGGEFERGANTGTEILRKLRNFRRNSTQPDFSSSPSTGEDRGEGAVRARHPRLFLPSEQVTLRQRFERSPSTKAQDRLRG